jgi:hypothetical protein
MPWSESSRAAQAARIRARAPWQKSTGPRTPEGKARSSRNANKGRCTRELLELAALLRQMSHASPQ